MATIVTRIKDYIDKKGISVSAFEKSIGMSNGTISKCLKREGGILSGSLETFLSTYPDINPAWLMTGEGSMLKTAKTAEQNEVDTIQPAQNATHLAFTSKNTKGLPYCDKNNIEHYDNADNSIFSVDDFLAGSADVLCTCTEHSMSPAISYGDILALRRIKNDCIIYGEIYAILLDNERLIRQIRKGNSPDKLAFVPFNTTDYQTQEFAPSRITSIYKVIACIHRFS